MLARMMEMWITGIAHPSPIIVDCFLSRNGQWSAVEGGRATAVPLRRSTDPASSSDDSLVAGSTSRYTPFGNGRFPSHSTTRHTTDSLAGNGRSPARTSGRGQQHPLLPAQRPPRQHGDDEYNRRRNSGRQCRPLHPLRQLTHRTHRQPHRPGLHRAPAP